MTPLRCANQASAARSFLQIANRNYSTTITRSSPFLEFLLPRRIPSSKSRKAYILRGAASSTRTSSRMSCFDSPTSPAPSRSFTTSAIRNATVCVRNPVQDEDGNDMILEITPRAAKRLSQIMTKDGNPNLALRIQVESGGCHGFQYLMSLITMPVKGTPEWSSVVNEDDSIFQFVPDAVDAGTATPDQPKIILDEPSLELLKGSKVDFTMELIGSEFKIIDNPHASSSCGCGTSFDIKM